MSKTRKIFLFIPLPLAIIFGLTAYFTFGSSKSDSTSGSESTSTKNGECPALITPVEVSLVTSILYPGQTRGGDYKPHGGFRMDNTENNSIDVKAPLAAKVTNGSRYIEMNELQYMFDFKTDCGIEYRFEHLKTLSPKLQVAADKLPEAKVDDSQTTNIRGVTVTSGEVIATAVGFEQSLPDAPVGPNVSFDFGLYDERQKNASSKDPAWVSSHKGDGDQAIYAVCWLDWLPVADTAILKTLPGGDAMSGKTSDYCN